MDLVDAGGLVLLNLMNLQNVLFCCLVKNRKLNSIDIIPSRSMKILRETPTSTIVRFKARGVEPARRIFFPNNIKYKKI